MAFPDELLELAQDLADLHPERPHQASLRRAVSRAYYAIFHLLISETTANWARPELRAVLGRCFDHGPMKTVAIHLRTVANASIQAQQRRNDADYNLAKEWTPVEVDKQIASVNEAFKAWNIIRNEAVAQTYLVSLLGAKERRPNEPQPPQARAERKKKRPTPGSSVDSKQRS